MHHKPYLIFSSYLASNHNFDHIFVRNFIILVVILLQLYTSSSIHNQSKTLQIKMKLEVFAHGICSAYQMIVIERGYI